MTAKNSMLTPKFPGKTKDGKLFIERRDLFEDYLRTIEGESGEVEVMVQKRTKKRSSRQNRYYNGVVLKILGKELGYDRDEMHEVVRRMFLTDTSRRFPTVRSTTKLNTAQMEEYLATIRQWASKDLNIYIPLPNEVHFDDVL